jgi:hypothetical protein
MDDAAVNSLVVAGRLASVVIGNVARIDPIPATIAGSSRRRIDITFASCP